MWIKKSQLGWVLIIFIILVIVIGIIVLLSFLNKKSQPSNTTEVKYIDLFIRSIDYKSKELIETNYTLTSNNMIISSGKLGDWINLKVNSNNSYELTCYNSDHYPKTIIKNITNEELRLNASKIICDPFKIGNIQVKSFGSISSNYIILNISTDGLLKNLMVCEGHTMGILNIGLDGLTCEGYWNNISSYLQRKYYNGTRYLIPIYYPNNTRNCGDWKLKCSDFKFNMCFIDKSEVPERLKSKADSCYKLQKNIYESNIKLIFNLDTFNINYHDKIDFYILDEDLISNAEDVNITIL